MRGSPLVWRHTCVLIDFIRVHKPYQRFVLEYCSTGCPQKKLLTESWGLDFWPQKLVSQHCPQNSVSNCRKSDTSSLLFLGSHCTLWKRSQILWRERSKDDQGHVWEEQEGNRHCVSRVSHQNQNLRGSKTLIDIHQHHNYKLKLQVRPQNWQHPNDIYAWQGLKIVRFFASFERCSHILSETSLI